MTILFIIILIISAILTAYTNKMQASTLYIGKKICSPEMKDVMPTGYQDAITPEDQNKRNLYSPILFVAILIVGSLIKWYMGILGLLLNFIVLIPIASFFVPQKLSFYVNLLHINMANRFADYKKNGDEERTIASKEILEKLEQYYFLMDKNIKVPNIYEANMTDFGY